MRALLCGLGLAALPWSSLAAAFQADSVVVLRVGDGVSSLTGRTAAVSLDEYGLNGQLRQTITLPADASNHALTLRGSSGGEGAMSLSGDGQSLTLAGYGLAADQLRTAAWPHPGLAQAVAWRA